MPEIINVQPTDYGQPAVFMNGTKPSSNSEGGTTANKNKAPDEAKKPQAKRGKVDMTKFKCFGCQQFRHYKLNCPKKKKNDEEKPSDAVFIMAIKGVKLDGWDILFDSQTAVGEYQQD